MDETLKQDETKLGAFTSSLKRNNKQIREDRAQAIGEEAQLVFKRTVEDLEMALTRLRRKQENNLDLSPDTAMSLIVADKFDARTFTDNDIAMSVEIRNLEIKLGLAKQRLVYLFGGV